MTPTPGSVLLLGATTPVGHALLLRLALVGFEVVAHLPNGDDGRTGEFACRLTREPADLEAALQSGAALVDAESAPDAAVVVTIGGTRRRFAHAPTFGAVRARLAHAGWRIWCGDPWHGLALPLVHERDVAQIVTDALAHDRPETAIGGPELLSWRQVVTAVFTSEGRWRPWHRAAGWWSAPAHPAPALAAVGRYPRVGRRTLTDALRRRESAAHSAVAPVATAASHTFHS